MQAGNVYRLRTVAAQHFTGACNQNAALTADLDLFATDATKPLGDLMGLGAGKHLRSRIRELRILSQQNLAWEVWWFGASMATQGGAVIGTEKYLGRWTFIALDGIQATGDTFFYYYINGLDIAYQDLDLTGKMHMRLVNRSAAAKLAAGAGGNIEIEMGLELLQGR